MTSARNAPWGTRADAPAAGAGARPALLLAATLALVTLAYAGSLSGGFVWDDHALIEEAPHVRELQPLPDYFRRSFWDSPRLWAPVSFYRPLTTLSYALEHRVWGDAAPGYRVTNLLLHLAVCVLLFALCRRAGAGPPLAALATALFGVFPRLSESVAWISGRTDLLAALGVLAALWLHDTRPRAHARRVAAAAVLLLAALCKEVALAGAAAIVALELAAPERRRLLPLARRLAPTAAALALWAALAVPALASQEMGDLFGPGRRMGFALQALGSYALAILDPLRPRIEIGRLAQNEALPMLAGAVLLVALGALGLRSLRRPPTPPVLAGSVLALAALAPVLHLVPLPVRSLAADRYLYLPLAGAVLALAAGAARTHALRGRGPAAAGLALAALFALATHARALEWADELRLWQTAIEHAPDHSGLAHVQRAEALARRGRFEEALAHYRRGFALEEAFAARHPEVPADRRILGNIAACLSELGRVAEAIRILEELVLEQPDVPLHRFNLGLALARQLEFARADAQLGEALRLDAGYDRARALQGDVRAVAARWGALPPENPDEPLALRAERAGLLARIGRVDEAQRLWAQVAEASGAGHALLERAARFLVARGDLPAAERAVARLQREAPARGVLLEPALVARRMEAAR